MNYTKQYHLPQWAESDRILMDDFNQAMEDIETGLGSAEEGRSRLEARVDREVEALTAAMGSGGKTCRVAYGSYKGSGTFGAANPVRLSFDFKPVLVLMACSLNDNTNQGAWPSTLLRGVNCTRCCYGSYVGTDGSIVTWGDRDVSIHSTSQPGEQNNISGVTYYYVAFGYTE